MPELLGKEGNKLLKLIEEPPPKTLFLLVAENEELILPTLVSRCQLIKVPPIQDDAIAQALQQLSVAQAQAQQIASVVQGNFREAQWLIQQPANNWQQLLTDWLHILLNDEKTEQLKWIDMVASLGREKQKQFLRYIIHLLEDAIHVRIYPQPSNMFPEEKDTAIKINKITSVSQQQAIADELNKAIYYIERNAHAKMLFHALTIKLYHIIRHKTLILTAS
jgi:DNA polymerase-3 subunit delta'